MTRMKHHVGWAFLTVFLAGIPLLMLMNREPPYVIEKASIEPNQVVQGGEISITFTVRQLRTPCGPGLIYREFKELGDDPTKAGKIHHYDPVQRRHAPEFTEGTFVRTSKLPDAISPGRTEYRGAACYYCNVLQWWLRWPVCVETPPVRFTVLEKVVLLRRREDAP